MQLRETIDILLINLPCTSPAMPASGAEQTGMRLSQAGQSCVFYDASLDFFLNYVFSEKYFDFFRQMIEKKIEKKIIPSSHAEKIKCLGSDLTNRRVSVTDMRKDIFYHPETFMKIRDCVDNFLLWFSHAFFPCRFDSETLAFPDKISLHDAQTNPFVVFCRELAIPAAMEFDPAVIVFYLTHPGQTLALRTIQNFMKTQFPDVKFVTIKADDGQAGNMRFHSDGLKYYPDEACLAPEPVYLPCLAYDSGNFSGEICSSPMICWNMPQNGGKLDFMNLRETSRKGIWNHVRILRHTSNDIKEQVLKFAGSNPDVIHSLENNDGKTRTDDRFLPYSAVAPLPGEPFWRILREPAYIMLYIRKYGRKTLFSMRGDREKQSVIQLGSNISYYFKKPCDLPAGFLDEICKMVEAGGSVDIKYVRYNLERAYLIAYAMENGIIAGNSSLKHPRRQFIQRLAHTAGIDFSGFLERGYTSVRPEYRAMGIGTKLLEGLTARAGSHGIFSIISEDNEATKKIAIRNKTRKIASYFSEKTGKQMEIWMPEHMIESLKISVK
jgi:GNAT superfamily N-acetyltransferase